MLFKIKFKILKTNNNMCLPFVLGDVNFVIFILGIVCGSLGIVGIMNSLSIGIVLLVIAGLVLLVGLGSRGVFGGGGVIGYGVGGFLLGDLNFIVFALSLICGSLVLAGIMTGYQGGIVLIVIGILVFFVTLGSRGLFHNNVVGGINRGIA